MAIHESLIKVMQTKTTLFPYPNIPEEKIIYFL